VKEDAMEKTTLIGIGVALALSIGAGACGAIDDGAVVEAVPAALTDGLGNCPDFPETAMCACQGSSFTGSCMIFTHETRFYMNLSLAPHQAFNDAISSFIIGPAAKVKFCQHPGGAGTCVIQPGAPGAFATSDIASLSGAGRWPGGMDNQITSIRIDGINDDCQHPGPGQAAVFEDPNFNFWSTRDCVVLDVGTYPHPFKSASSGHSGGGYGLNTDVITSVKSGGAWIALYADPDFNGGVAATTAEIANLGGMNMNDKTSSIRVSLTPP
jgi:hypothetical protein